MAKRIRGSSTRPGQRARLQRRASSPPVTNPPERPTTSGSTSLTAAEEARAAELEAQIVAAERSVETTVSRSRERGRRTVESETRVRTGSIAERASLEYAYVARDVRKIVVIGGSLILLLFALFIVLQASGIARA